MGLQKLNPATPARALTGSGTLISSAAINPENTLSTVIVNRLSRQFGITAPHAALVARLAGLGPHAEAFR